MKFFHLSDLHLGKRLNEFPLIDDQAHILGQILEMMDAECPDALIVAGDVYDKTTPSAEAVTLFDDFLWEVARRKVPVLVVSGNHDSPERLAFGSRIMEASQVHISRSYVPGTPPVTLTDEFGPVRFHLLPFVKPVHVRHALEGDFPEEAEAISSYTDALAAAVAHLPLDEGERNVLVAHQFVTGAVRSESEDINIGSLDNVDVSVFDAFDYVALGHIHGPQRVGREVVRYCGTPLKYSFSEAHHEKSVTVVEMGSKGEVSIRLLPLSPLRDLREIRGTYDELTLKSTWENTATDDFIHVTLTDEDDVPNAVERLRTIYPNVLLLTYDNLRTRSGERLESLEAVEQLTPTELFCQFFEQQNGQPMSDSQDAYVRATIERIWEGAS